jgi:hypothetical protein
MRRAIGTANPAFGTPHERIVQWPAEVETSRRWDSMSCLRNTSRISRLYIAKLKHLILAVLRREFSLGTQIELGRVHTPNSFTRRYK